jgi:hypothetical protein
METRSADFQINAVRLTPRRLARIDQFQIDWGEPKNPD